VHSSKHAWRPALLSSVLNPVLYLAALGVGLGALVDRSDPGGLGGVGYLTFVAPGLLAATAMQIAAAEASGPVRSAFQWTKAYHAMLATPLHVRDVLNGHLLWILLRVATSCAIYATVIAAFGAFDSPWALLALPVAMLTGMAFAAPMAQITPLYQGIELVRPLTTGTVGTDLLGHIAYLAAMSAISLRVATRRLDRRLRV
jgi:lipooligosaccharide transport system permease protein